VFAPDGDLQRLSFATLRNPDTGRFLIEERAILATPSASVFVAAATRIRASAGRPMDSALLVGNPAGSGDALSTQPALPGSESEAIAAGQFYPHREVLTGATATRTRFVESAGRYAVVHFGGH